MDNLGRDMERMMYALLALGFLAGAGIAAIVIWAARRFA